MTLETVVITITATFFIVAFAYGAYEVSRT